MATRLIIRRGTGTPPSDLKLGELAYSTDTGKLYVGTEEQPIWYKEINSIESLSDFGIDASSEEINILQNLTASTNELNKLDGATVTTSELNLLAIESHPENAEQTTGYPRALQESDFRNLIRLDTLLGLKSDVGHSHSLGDLTNVSLNSIESADENYVLKFNGEIWQALPDTNTDTLDTLGETLEAADAGKVVQWNGTGWVADTDDVATLTSLGITVTAADINTVTDKLSKTESGQVITQNITMGPIGQPGDDAGSRQIIFNSTTTAGGGADVFKSLFTNNAGQLIFDGTRVLTTGAVSEDFLGFNEEQTLTAGQKDTLLSNIGLTPTLAELNRVDGVTQNIQVQLDTLDTEKAPINSPHFTGTPTMSTNLVIGDADNRVANKKYVDDRVSSIVSGSGTYIEEEEVTLTNGQVYSYSLINSFDKVFLTLYLTADNNTWTSGAIYNSQTIPSYPSLDLARITRTETSTTEGTCVLAPQYNDDPETCAVAGYAFQFDTITYAKNPRMYIGPDGAYLVRISEENVQFVSPTAVTDFTWKLKITGVNF